MNPLAARFHSFGHAVRRFPRPGLLSLLITLLVTVPLARAQDWAANFNSPGTDGSVSIRAIAQTADAYYYGGSFSAFGATTAANIVRVDKLTGAVSALGGGVNSTVNALAVSGNILYVGGSFHTAGGIAATNIAQWDGTSWSALGAGDGNGVNSTVNALAVSGTDLYVGGAFTSANAGGSGATPALTANKVAKWDGSAWSALGAGDGNGVGPALITRTVNALAVVGTDLYVGGFFTLANVGGTGATPALTANNIAKWDGGNWSAVGSGDGNGVNRVGSSGGVFALAANGTDLYVGGAFNSVNLGGDTDDDPPIGVANLARWDGAKWSAVGSDDAGYGVGFKVQAFAAIGTDLYVGGVGSDVDDPLAVPLIAKWDGSVWSDLGSGDGDGVNKSVNALATSGTNLLVGGGFSRANYGGTGATPEILVSGIAQWDGTMWSPAVTTVGDGLNGQANAIVDAGSVVYVGGQFTAAGIVAANGVACWHKASRTWSALGSGITQRVYSLVLSGTNLYAGGSFASAGGVAATNIARWDGTAWSAVGDGVGTFVAGNSVNALAVIGGNLYAGGSFASAGGIAATNIAVWDGSAWSALSAGGMNGMDGAVNALATIGTDLYAGGAFGSAGGGAVGNVAKWDGSAWSPLGRGVGGEVHALAASGTSLYVGGHFGTAYDSITELFVGRVAKWDGSAWSVLGSESNYGVYSPENYFSDVNALAVSGTNLYVGGTFVVVGFFELSGTDDGSAIGANRIAKWNGSAWSALGDGTGNNEFDTVTALAVNGSDVYVSGSFSVAGGKAADHFSEYGPPVLGVEQPVNTALVSGGTQNFGTVAKDAAASSLTFTVRNTGPINLSGLVLTVDGPAAAQFTVTASPADPVAPVGSTTFNVQFLPTANGAQTATLHVASNDPDHSPFDIMLTGTGTGFNAPPVAGTDSLSRPNSGPTIKVLTASLLANDTDADGDPLTLTAVGDALPAGATVTLSGNFVLYAAPSATAGNGSFTYTLSDGPGGHTVTGTVTVTEITPVIDDSPANATHIGFDGGGHFVLTFIGVPGHGYRVQYTTALGGATAWQEFTGPALHTAPDSGVFTHTDTDPPDASRFYRAVPNP